MSTIANELLRRTMPNRLKDDPNLPKERNDNEGYKLSGQAKCKESNTAIVLPSLEKLRNDREEPRCKHPTTASELLVLRKSLAIDWISRMPSLASKVYCLCELCQT